MLKSARREFERMTLNETLDDTTQAAKTAMPPYRWAIAAIAIAGLIAALLLGLGARQHETSLRALAATSVPFDAAMANSQPTLVEFYADWCATCQAMAPDAQVLRQQFGDEINFVMLNVDNNKWLPELTRFRVDGIPHFVFLDRDNRVLGSAIGLLPRAILADNLTAMLDGNPLPHAELTAGRASPLAGPKPADSTQPRDHA